MLYTFAKENEMTVQVKCLMSEIEGVTVAMEAKGYRRIFDPPNVVIYPTYTEALEETDELYAQAARGEGELVGTPGKFSKDLPPLTLNDLEALG